MSTYNDHTNPNCVVIEDITDPTLNKVSVLAGTRGRIRNDTPEGGMFVEFDNNYGITLRRDQILYLAEGQLYNDEVMAPQAGPPETSADLADLVQRTMPKAYAISGILARSTKAPLKALEYARQLTEELVTNLEEASTWVKE
jgi:hypothetical protein